MVDTEQDIDQEQEQIDPPQKLKVNEFAAKIKEKYPSYKDVNDTDLVNKIIEKYPSYKDQVDFTPIEKKNQFGNVSWNGGVDSQLNGKAQSELSEENKSPSGKVNYQQQPTYNDGNTLGFKTSDVTEATPLVPKAPLGKAALLGLSSVASSTLKSIGIAAKNLDLFGEYGDKKAEDLATYKAGQWIDDTVKDLVGDLTPEEQGMFAVKLAQAGGNMLGFTFGGLGGKVLKMSPLLTTAALGSAVQGASEWDAAIQSGSTPEEAAKVFWLNSVIGTTEALPIMGAFRKLDKYTGGLATGALAKKLASSAGGRMTNEMVGGFVNEAAQESVTQLLSNTVAKNTYDVTRSIWDGVLESGAIGGIIGSTMTGALSAIREKRMAGGLTKEEDTQLAEAEKFATEKLEEATNPDKAEVTTPTSNNPKVKAIIKAKTDIEADLASNDKLPEETKAVMLSEVEKLNQDLEVAKSEVYQGELNERKAVELEDTIKKSEELLKDETTTEATKSLIQKSIDENKSELEKIKPPEEEIKSHVPKAEDIKVDDEVVKRSDDLFKAMDKSVERSWDDLKVYEKNKIKIVNYTNPSTMKEGERSSLETVAKNFKKAHNTLAELINC